MENCSTCPYPQKCGARGQCLTGKVAGEATTLPQPKPMSVLTTAGMSMTGIIKSVKRKQFKKAEKK